MEHISTKRQEIQFDKFPAKRKKIKSHLSLMAANNRYFLLAFTVCSLLFLYHSVWLLWQSWWLLRDTVNLTSAFCCWCVWQWVVPGDLMCNLQLWCCQIQTKGVSRYSNWVHWAEIKTTCIMQVLAFISNRGGSQFSLNPQCMRRFPCKANIQIPVLPQCCRALTLVNGYLHKVLGRCWVVVS